jgi:hypothetical protein
VAINIKVTDIPWDSVRMVSIDGCRLEVVTEHGKFDFSFPATEQLSEALLILALQGTKSVEHRDDLRFNPARLGLETRGSEHTSGNRA